MSEYNTFRKLCPEHLEATSGNACAALLLDLFAYWTDSRAANNAQAQSGGKEGNDLWFYRSLADLHADLYGAFGRAAIRTALQLLHDRGLIESRTNPVSPWDRTLQYRILHGAKSDDVHGAEPDDDAGARPSPPTEARTREGEGEDRDHGSDENGTALASTKVVRELFEFWQERCGHPQAKMTSERSAKITARLKEGYTARQIATGIKGAAIGAFVNEAGKRFDDIELICRNGSKLEDFIERATSNGARHSAAEPSTGPARMRDMAAQLRQEAADLRRAEGGP
jgi:hypothetical protein